MLLGTSDLLTHPQVCTSSVIFLCGVSGGASGLLSQAIAQSAAVSPRKGFAWGWGVDRGTVMHFEDRAWIQSPSLSLPGCLTLGQLL